MKKTMYNYIERITEPIIDFKEDVFPLLENINEENILELLKSLELSVSNGWVGEASEISDSMLNSDIVKSNPKALINIHLERMKKYHYFGLHNLAKQASRKVLDLLEKNSSSIEKNIIDFWKFTAVAQLGWIEKDILKLDKIIEQSNSIKIQASCENQKIMEAFLTGLSGKRYLMEKSIPKGKEYFNKGIALLEQLKYHRAVAHLKVYFAENIFQYSSKEESYQIASKLLNENETNRFKSHLVLRVYTLLIKSNIEDNEKKRKHILSLQVLMYAMGLGQSQKIYPFIKSAFELIDENERIDFFNLNFKIWLDTTINNMPWEEYESLIVKYYKDRNYFFVEKLPDNFPVFDIIAKGHYNGNEMATLIQAKHWNNTVYKKNIQDGFRFEEAFNVLKERYNLTTVNFIVYYLHSGIENSADAKIRGNVKHFISNDVRVDIKRDNDEIINFYLKNPSKIMKLFMDNY